jgi:hypothetical protein
MGRHHHKPSPATPTRSTTKRPPPRLELPQALQDYLTWPVLSLALAMVLTLGIVVGILIS